MSQPNFASNPAQTSPSFSIAQAVNNIQSTAHSFHASTTSPSRNACASSSTSTFKVPAHKHAHHLHSIPPREKSTRTLIIDHMLWVHGRTRFAQARAELGMTDRTGGPSSSKHLHRHRPENYEEDDEIESDGEDVDILKARSLPHDEDEEGRQRRQDMSLARNLRLRAEGLEKVVTSMLVQLPPVQPIHEDDLELPPTSPHSTSSTKASRHQHTLPNGVRLRLALATVINDLFARQNPPQTFRYKHQHASQESTPPATQNSSSPSLPPALSLLSPLSSYSRSDHDPNNSQHDTEQRGRRKPDSRARELYESGADSDTANSSPASRCPRHLHTSCEICAEAKSRLRPLSVSTGKTPMGPPPTNTFNVMNGIGSTWNSWKGTPIGIAPDGGGMSGWQDGVGVGEGLLQPPLSGTVLRRKSKEPGAEGGIKGDTKLAEMIPRFLRLSALIAAELGREVREAREVEGIVEEYSDDSESEDEGSDEGGDDAADTPDVGDTSSASTPHSHHHQQPHHFHNKFYQHALKPSKEWYFLLAGLLTRAALQGYLGAGWTGTDAVECLMTVGVDTGTVDSKRSEVVDPDLEWEDFEPDELPSLSDSVRMLFPCGSAKTHAGEEYEAELDERLRKFLDVPPSTPDLSTHMEDLAWQYPAEVIERAALRFCEAIAKWRGKPELEMYKKNPPKAVAVETDQEIGMSIESLVHSNPSSPQNTRKKANKHKPIIELYFLQPTDADHHLSSPLITTASIPPPPSFISTHLHKEPQHRQQQYVPTTIPSMIMGTTPATWGYSAWSGSKRAAEEDSSSVAKRFKTSGSTMGT